MNYNYIDAHTHIHFPEFDDDREQAIARAHAQGVGMITVGTDIALTTKAIEVAKEYEGIWATAGIHPHEAKTYQATQDLDEHIKQLSTLAQQDVVVGIGECGIDLFRSDDRAALSMQEELFIKQLELAHSIQKPIIIHSRGSSNGALDGLEHILTILESHKSLLTKEGVCHFFTGDKAIADRFLSLGFSFTFGGLITFNRDFDEVINYIPTDRIMAETDAPFVAPASHRGERNEPSYVPEVAVQLAQIKGSTPEKLLPTLAGNAVRVFSLA
jgi:TatD DNase family protein